MKPFTNVRRASILARVRFTLFFYVSSLWMFPRRPCVVRLNNLLSISLCFLNYSYIGVDGIVICSDDLKANWALIVAMAILACQFNSGMFD